MLEIKLVRRILAKIFLWVLFSTLFSCASKKLNFESTEKAELYYLENVNGEMKGEKISELPVSLSVDELDGRILKVVFEKSSEEQYWVFDESLGDTNNFKLIPSGTKLDEKVDESRSQKFNIEETNKMMRLTLESFKALIDGKIEYSKAKANEIAERSSKLAIGQVLNSMIEFERGNRDKAIIHLQNAAKLDPTDQNIKKILEDFEN